MLVSHAVFEISREAYRLLCKTSIKATNGRLLRRFIERVAEKGLILQVFAQYNEGWSTEQLKALASYAEGLASEALSSMPEGLVKFVGTECDEGFGLVHNIYKLELDISQASMRQLRAVIEFILRLSDAMHAFVTNPNGTALHSCPDYTYRSLPCSIAPDEQLWAIGGSDKRGGSGVLEWCYDEADAQEMLSVMSKHGRFENLAAEPWAKAQSENQQVALAC